MIRFSRQNMIAVSMVLAFGATSAAQVQTDNKAVERARSAFALIRDGQLDAFLAQSTERVKAKLSRDDLASAWKQVQQGYGDYEREIRVETTRKDESVTVSMASQFSRAAMNVQIIFDGKGKIDGLLFTPASEDVDYTAPPYVDINKFTEEEVTVSAGEFPLPGTISLPKGGGPWPAAVLVHGSGPHDRDETIFKRKPFKDIAWGLASRGIAILRYEKRTKKYGASMDAKTINAHTEVVDDAMAAVRLLKKRSDIDPTQIFVIGHSLGGYAAPYIGVNEPACAGVVLLAGPARPLYELIAEQIPYLAGLDGNIDEQEQTQIDAIQASIAKLRSGAFTTSDTLLGAPASYWADLDKLAPVASAKVCDKPILIVQGGRDYQVTTEDLAIWKKTLSGRKNVTFKLFPAMDHLFLAGTGPSTPEQYMEPGYVDGSVIAFLADWLGKQK